MPLEQVEAGFHLTDERIQQAGRLIRSGGQRRQPGGERRQLYAPLTVDADQRHRKSGQARDEIPLVHALTRLRGAQGQGVRNGLVVADERGSVLPQSDRHHQRTTRPDPAGQPHPMQHVIAGHPQLHEPRPGRDHVHRVHTERVPQTLTGRDHVRRLHPRDKAEGDPKAGRGRRIRRTLGGTGSTSRRATFRTKNARSADG